MKMHWAKWNKPNLELSNIPKNKLRSFYKIIHTSDRINNKICTNSIRSNELLQLIEQDC